MQIKNSLVLITGANRGIGLGLAQMCAREGARLILTARQPMPELAKELEKLGSPSARVVQADLSTRSGTAALIEKVGQEPIDILINNAGQLTGGLIEEQPLDDIYSMFQVNLISLVHLTRGILPGMIQRQRGKIINNASVSAIMHFPCASTYAASKAAVMAFTNSIASEVKGTGVSTLCLYTPGVKTRMFDEIEVKYAKNLEIPQGHISTEEYANQVLAAILDDRKDLYPSGSTAIGLNVARYLPGLFRSVVQKKFHRQ